VAVLKVLKVGRDHRGGRVASNGGLLSAQSAWIDSDRSQSALRDSPPASREGVRAIMVGAKLKLCEHSNTTAQAADCSQSIGRLNDLERRLGALALQADSGAIMEPQSPFVYVSEEEDIADGSERQAVFDCMRRKSLDGATVDNPVGAVEPFRPGDAGRAYRSADDTGVKCVGACRNAPAKHLVSESAAGDQPWAKVVVSPMPHFRVQSADSSWLRLFGFSLGEVQNRSLRIATGPKTRLPHVSEILDRAGSSPTAHEWITLYKKNGDELSLVIRARLETDSGHVALEMKSLDSVALKSEGESLSVRAELEILSRPPHDVIRVNRQCEQMFGLAEERFKEGGMAQLFTAQTSRTRWKNLIKSAAEGATRSCPMSLRGPLGVELAVAMEISPQGAVPLVAGLHPTLIVRVSLCTDARSPGSAHSHGSLSSSSASLPLADGECWGDGSAESLSRVPFSCSSAGGSTSGDVPGPPRARCTGPVVSAVENTGRAHLRAFAAARKKKEAETQFAGN
jgi:hypothetical protein